MAGMEQIGRARGAGAGAAAGNRIEIIPWHLTIGADAVYNVIMKKIFIGFLLAMTLAITGCGAKTALDRPDPSFPRAYPVD